MVAVGVIGLIAYFVGFGERLRSRGQTEELNGYGRLGRSAGRRHYCLADSRALALRFAPAVHARQDEDIFETMACLDTENSRNSVCAVSECLCA